MSARRLPLLETLQSLADAEASIEVDVELGDLVLKRKVAKAYVINPAGRKAFRTPCFLNFWRPVVIGRSPNEVREDEYVIVVQCFVAPSSAEQDVRSILATAFWEEFLFMLDRNLAFGLEGVHGFEVRGDQDEMPVVFDRGNGYIGWQCELGVRMTHQSSFGIGRRS